jgi:RND family efflux transporter MFP subunit
MRRFLMCGAELAAVAALAFVLSGCDRQSAAGTQDGAPPVTVASPIERMVTDYEDYTGRAAAIESVQITPRVTGYLDKIYFREGIEVTEGTVLYEIDPRPYQAAFDQAQAQVAQNQASLKLATANRHRYEELFQRKAATAQDVETYRSQELQAAATLAAAQANLETARLNLGWTKVTAPITGRLGQTLVSRGNLVTADRTELTTMVSLDPMYVFFDVDERTVERIQQLIREGKLKSALPEETETPKAPDSATSTAGGNKNDAASGAPNGKGPLAVAIRELRERAGEMRQVYLGLANEVGNPHVAYVDFVNNQINLATATLQVRGIFWNPKPPIGPRVFDSGMFVRVRVPTSPTYHALLVSQEAIGTELNLKYVDVLNDQDEVVRHDVKLGGLQDGLQVVVSGLQPHERVVINGLQKVSPGSKAKPKLVQMPARPADVQPLGPSRPVKTQPADAKSGSR